MCDPASISAAIIVTGLVAGTTSAAVEQKSAEEKKKAADKALMFEVGESAAITQQEAEVSAEESFQLAREAAINRGLAQNSGLGVTSVRALSQAVGFDLGQDRATLQKNMKTANADAMRRVEVANANREAAYAEAGDTTGLRMGLQIGGAIVAAAAGGAGVVASANAANATAAATTLGNVATNAGAAGNTALQAAATAAQTAATATAASTQLTANAWMAGSAAIQVAAAAGRSSTSG